VNSPYGDGTASEQIASIFSSLVQKQHT